MCMRHEVYSGKVHASPEQVFDLLDDPKRLSAHMAKRSWKIGWGKTEILLDEQHGKVVGSHIVLQGRVFGIPIYLDEVVTQRERPLRKSWETVGAVRLLVLSAYTMHFTIANEPDGVLLKVEIGYDLPRHGITRVLGRLLGASYARWCTKKMVRDAQAAFS